VDIHGTGDRTANTTTNHTKTADETATKNSIRESSPLDLSFQIDQKITDPYDPFVPNDLLDYWEKLAAKKHREHLERETKEALERQKEMRKQLEEERSEIRMGVNLNMATGMGRGRGRGLSNLPAWLVEEQRKENRQQQSRVLAGEEVVAGTVGPTNPPTALGRTDGMGRGRGRGISNLPAWLVAQQRQEAAAKGQ